MTNKFMKNKEGFSLYELIVIIAIIAILVLFATPKFSKYIKAAEVTNVINDTKVAEDKVLEYMIKNNEDIPTSGTLVTADELQIAINERKLYDSRGLASAIDASKNYELLDTSYIKEETKTNLDGDFISSIDGENVYYLSNEKIENIDDVKKFIRLIGSVEGTELQDVIQTTDNGYIIVGNNYSGDGDFNYHYGESDAFIMKLNSEGDISWFKIFGGSQSDMFFSVENTLDGGYIAVGKTISTDGDLSGHNKGLSDGIIVKYASNGDVDWYYSFGGTNKDIFYDIKQLSDGSFIVAGTSASNNGDLLGLNIIENNDDGILAKFDSNGNLLWVKNLFSEYSLDEFYRIQITPNGFVTVGRSSNGYGLDGLISSFDSNGNILWSNISDYSILESFEDVCLAIDGGYIVAAYVYSGYNGDDESDDLYDSLIIKYDENGIIEWTNNIVENKSEDPCSIIPTTDGNYLLTTNSDWYEVREGYYVSCSNILTVKLDKNGNTLWTKKIEGSDFVLLHSMIQTTYGEYIGVGYSTTPADKLENATGTGNGLIVKFDSACNIN